MRHARGLSLIELMVAMALSLVLLAGALSILYSSKVTNTENDRIARLQENGRAAVELMLRDARTAGYQGCSRPGGPVRFDNLLANPADTLWNLQQPMFGFEATGANWTPALDVAAVPSATPGSDVLVLRSTRQGTPVFRLSSVMTNGSSPLSVDGPAGATVAVGDTLVITDCSNAGAFAVTGFTPGAPATITHGNLDHVYLLNSQIVQMDTVIYYVRDSTSGLGPALWRRIGNAAPQILVEGVENLQILYGESLTGGRLADVERPAPTRANWNNVVSLTMAVLLRSEAEENLDFDTKTYNLLGTDYGPFKDRRQRTVFTTTATLRNRSR
jgi:type IV pilus assembly protein PilW